MSAPSATVPLAPSLPRGIRHGREVACLECAAPCASQRDEAHHADPCAACPLGLWHPVLCAPGDALAAGIERHLLSPLEQALPAAAPLVDAVRHCGGCTAAKHQLGSTTPHPDTDVPVI